MRKLLCALGLYILLAVILLPLAVTLLMGGFGGAPVYTGICVMF